MCLMQTPLILPLRLRASLLSGCGHPQDGPCSQADCNVKEESESCHIEFGGKDCEGLLGKELRMTSLMIATVYCVAVVVQNMVYTCCPFNLQNSM